MKNNIFRSNIRINYKPILSIATLTILSIFILNVTTRKSPLKDYGQMLSASQKMNLVYNKIYKYRLRNNILVNQIYDPNQTGFIGEEFSLITTTLGNLDSKQTALNPDFTALMIKWVLELNISAGDTVVIHASASFPALTIMAVITCEELNLKPVIFTSIGASSWGANLTDMTYLDIENYLYTTNIIKHRSSFVTPGGTNDNGSSLWEGGMEIIQQSTFRNNYTLHVSASLDSSIIQKWDMIKKIHPALFINIGGNHTAMGDGNCVLHIPVGLIRKPLECAEGGLNGLIYKCSNAEIPVMHFLKIKEIAFINGIELSPGSFKNVGQADIYFQKKISIKVAIISFILIFSILIMLRKKLVYKTPSNSSTISTNLK